MRNFVKTIDYWLLDYVFQPLYEWTLLYGKNEEWCVKMAAYVTIGLASLVCIIVPQTRDPALIGPMCAMVLIMLWEIYPVFTIVHRVGKSPTQEEIDSMLKFLESNPEIPRECMGRNPMRHYLGRGRRIQLSHASIGLFFVSGLLVINPELLWYLSLGYVYCGIGVGIYSMLAFASCDPPAPRPETKEAEPNSLPQPI